VSGPAEDDGARVRIPDLNGLVVARGDNAPAVRTESGLDHSLVVAAKAQFFLAGLHVPDPGCPIRARRDQTPAVGTEGHGPQGLRMSRKCTEQLARGHRPEVHFSSKFVLLGGRVRACCQMLPVRTKDDRINPGRMLQSAAELTGRGIPE